MAVQTLCDWCGAPVGPTEWYRVGLSRAEGGRYRLWDREPDWSGDSCRACAEKALGGKWEVACKAAEPGPIVAESE